MRTPTIHILLLLILIASFVMGRVTGQNDSKSEINTVEENTCKDIVKEFSSLYKATSEIGSIPYDSSFSDCYDHSKLLTKKLEKMNIKSSIMVNEDRSHAWVAVWIEATSGQFIPVDKQEKILEIRDGSDVTKVQCYNK